MYKLTFTLKQHTPLIHFQHDQHGATLRATEVKPKLDKYLLKQLGEGDYKIGIEKAKANNWLVGNGEHPALNYKMRFENVKGFEKQNINSYPNFFANMGDDTLPKHLIFSETVDLKINSFYMDLTVFLEPHLNHFFILNNFGSRQSKGFGSFTLEGDQQEFLKQLSEFTFIVNTTDQLGKTFPRDFTRMNVDQQKMANLFTQIEVFYKSLRSGINRKSREEKTGRKKKTNFYIKPAIFHYAKDVLNKQWDKKSIKEFHLSNYHKMDIQEHQESDILTYSSTKVNEHHLMLRDLFGLSNLEKWHYYDKAKVQKTHVDKKIDRFQSPLTFIPVKTRDNQYLIGVIISNINENFFDQKFKISFNGDTRQQLKTPDSFDWDNFLYYLKNNIPPVDERSSSDYPNKKSQPEFQILSNIYGQLHDQ